MALQNPMELLPPQIKELAEEWSPCKRCDLHKGIFNYVFYRGSCPAEILFIGEAPGNNEDKSGIPFIGRSGDILDGIIAESGVEFKYGVMNVISCIPKQIHPKTGKVGVRPPSKEEAEACRPRFLETIVRANPSLIVLLGKSAKKYINLPKELAHIPILELKHPAYMLRQGGKHSIEYRRSYLYLRETIQELRGQEIHV